MTKKTLLTITTLNKGPTAATDVRPTRSLRPMRSMNTRKSLRPSVAPIARVEASSEAKQ